MAHMTRRDFIRYTSTGLMAALLFPSIPAMGTVLETEKDEKIFLEKIKLAEEGNFISMPINEVVIETGKSFIGTPYEGNTLDSSGKEALVTNLCGLDCWTFFENSLVIGRVIKKGEKTFEDYKKELEFVRYRGGVRDGYASRIHYIVDWIYDNVRKGVVSDLAKELGGVKLNKNINFMTSHRDLYPPLKSDECWNKMKKIEKDISSRDNYYVPTEVVADIESKLKNADIFGLVSQEPGLDAFHTGFIYKENGSTFILDAASSVGSVDIFPKLLSEYLNESGIPGIFIARPLEV